MFKRLYNFLETYNCIYNLQFGFREKHSTNHAILKITHEIKEAIENDNIAIGIFVDLQKAFDTVNHKILLGKLDYYGVKNVSNAWFRSYLSERKQYVSLNGVESTLKEMNHGVPQGSVLGPLLFLIYINDLHKCIHNSEVFHFADDTNLLYIPKNKLNNRSIRKLNSDLRNLNHWLLANKISLNSSKTEVIFFRKKGIEIPETLKRLRMNGVKLLPNSQIKYLGLIFDEHLTWIPQLQTLSAKLNRATNLITKVRYYVPFELLQQIYYNQFYSHLIYGCQIWGRQHIDENSNIFILQKKVLRKMTFSKQTDHTSPLFKKHKMLKLADIIKNNNFLFVHNFLNNKLSEAFKDICSSRT